MSAELRRDMFDPQARSALMSRIKRRDTGPEMALRRALWAAGVRGWRVDSKRVHGRPDLAWIGLKLAVFVDGAFWHGHPDHYHGQSGAFWDQKIQRNRNRDIAVNAQLIETGWTVLRFWDFELKRDMNAAVARIQQALREARKLRDEHLFVSPPARMLLRYERPDPH